MTAFEQALRAAMTDQVVDLPPMADPAGRAIARAAGVRRRANLGALVAGLAALVVLVGGVTTVRNPPIEQIMSDGAADLLANPPAIQSLGVDLRVGREIWTTEGDRLALPVSGDPTPAYVFRVPSGWIFGTPGTSARLLRADGVATDLGVNGSVVVSADGTQVAGWRNRRAAVVALVDAKPGPIRTTALPDRAVLITFVGSMVVLGFRDADNPVRISHWDLWDPRSDYVPTSVTGIEAVYGPAYDGSLIALVPRDSDDNALCLAKVKVSGSATLSVGTVRCGLGEWAGGRGVISPDGHYVAGTVRAGSTPAARRVGDDDSDQDVRTGAVEADGDGLGERVRIYDLNTVFAAGRAVSVCPGAGRLMGWESAHTLLVQDGSGLWRCGVDGSANRVPMPPIPLGTDWGIVSRLGR